MTHILTMYCLYFTLLMVGMVCGQFDGSYITEINATENVYAPVFNESYYNTSVEENLDNEWVIQVTAYDADDSSTPAGQIYYSITDGNYNGFFLINETTGDIFTTVNVDRETQEFVNLTVAAFDYGTPQMYDTSQVYIRILDQNDNPPVVDPSEMKARIPNDSAIGTFVINVNATDEDEVGELKYTFLSNTGDYEYYDINSTNGVITTIKLFENIIEAEHYLAVKVTDGSVAGFDYGHVLVEVYWPDPNECYPVFCETVYEYTIPSNIPIGTNLTEGCTILAYDKDKGPDGTVKYSIYHPNQRIRSKKENPKVLGQDTYPNPWAVLDTYVSTYFPK
ncbi:cadherin-5-like [Saccoglossus kowalevskii]